MKKISNRNTILVMIAIISVTILIICIILLSMYSISEYSSEKKTDEVRSLVSSESSGTGNIYTDEAVGYKTDEVHTQVLDKYSEAYKKNPDLAGWIKIENTHIDYPVMQSLYDEEYYLHRDFDGEDSDDGLPFMDIRCILSRPSTNYLIFGHNMKSGNMFADLLKYADKSFYDEHRQISFDTIYEEGSYEIIAVFRTRVAFRDENTFRFYNFIEADDTPEFNDYLDNIRALSLYKIDTEVDSSDRLLTLTTCEYTVEDGRFVVVAKKIN